MSADELHAKLAELRRLPGETEWAEFKQAEASFDDDKLGRYFLALRNEAIPRAVGTERFGHPRVRLA